MNILQSSSVYAVKFVEETMSVSDKTMCDIIMSDITMSDRFSTNEAPNDTILLDTDLDYTTISDTTGSRDPIR